MRNLSLLLLLLLALPAMTFAQATGDYRSKATGLWNAVSTWERYNGATWVAAPSTPTNADGVITIQNGHTVTNTSTVTVDQVVVNTSGILTISATFTINDGPGTDLSVNGTLNLTTGSLSGAGIMGIPGIFNWTGGYVSIQATITGAGTANLTGGELVLTNSLTNNGIINWGSSYLSFNGGIIINNNTINNTGDGTLYQYSGGGIITNSSGALFRKQTGTGITYSSIDFTNAGTVEVQSGTFEVYLDTLTTTGVLTISGGATFKTSFITNFNTGSTVTGSGTFHQNNSTLNINKALTIPSTITFLFTAGTISGNGSLSLAGTVNWSGGALNLPATFTVSSNTNLTGYEQVINKTLTNNGTINWGSIYLSFNGGILINNNTINNTSNGYFYRYSGGGLFTNNSGATFRKQTGTGVTNSGIDINNAGSFVVQSGTFEIGSDSLTNTGTVNISAGATFKISFVSTFNSGSTITGPGTFHQNNSSLLLNTPVSVASSTIFLFTGGSVNGSGSLTITGILNWSGGTLNLPTTLAGTAIANITGYEVVVNKPLTNNGTINWSNSYLSFNGGAVINNNIFNNTTDAILYRYTGGGLINNTSTGIFRKQTSAGTTTSGIDIINTGTIAVQSGIFEISSDTFSTSGVVNISSGATFRNNFVSIFNAGSTVSGAGVLQQNQSSFITNLALTIPSSLTFNFTGGTISGAGGLNIQGDVNWSSGSLNVPAAFATSTVANLTGYEQILRNTLTNNGTIFWKSVFLSFDNGTLNNNRFFIDSATVTNYFYKYAGTALFNNGTSGTFQKATSNVFELGTVPFTNNGTIKGLGTCNFGSSLTNAARGIFAPGNSPGILTTGTGYANRTLQIEMRSGGSAGNGFDQLQVNGIVQLRDTLKVFRTGVVPEGNYTVLTVLGTNDSIRGNFAFIQTPPGYVVTKTKKVVRVSVPKPAVSIRDSGVIEGNGGSKFMVFILTLNNPTAALATVNFSTQDSTATVAGGDYQSTAGIATFNPGENADTIAVRVYGDTTTESDEIFKVNLSNPVNVLAGDTTATGIIINNDGPVPAYVSSTADDLKNNSKIVIPNLITKYIPWQIQGISGTKNVILLFDASGRQVFETVNSNGQINLTALQTGNYFYQVQLTNTNGRTAIYKGQIIIAN